LPADLLSGFPKLPEVERGVPGEEAMNRREMMSGLAVAALWPASVRAQSFPNRPLRIIVPFAAGGAADLFARALAAKMGSEIGAQIVPEVHAGASGLTGVDVAAKSPPDGYTICLAGAAALSAIPYMVAKMPFDWQKDLALLTNVVRVPEVIIVDAKLGLNTLQDFVAYARANPGKVNFGSAGTGSITHLASELLKSEAKIDIVHIPYRGVAPAITDMLGGHIQMLTADVPFMLPHIRSGAVKALAVTSRARSSALPGVPTSGEAGYPRVNSDNWYGLVAPAGTPVSALDKVRYAALAALQSPDLMRQFETMNAIASPSSPAEFAAFIRAEQAKWGPVVTRIGIRLD
jgi:tripartite-type tricarboxylate transporter receptor subunit TctC